MDDSIIAQVLIRNYYANVNYNMQRLMFCQLIISSLLLIVRKHRQDNNIILTVSNRVHHAPARVISGSNQQINILIGFRKLSENYSISFTRTWRDIAVDFISGCCFRDFCVCVVSKRSSYNTNNSL